MSAPSINVLGSYTSLANASTPPQPQKNAPRTVAGVDNTWGASVMRGARAFVSAVLPCFPRLAAPEANRNKHKARRDWQAFPALVDLPAAPGDLYAVSDVHADPMRLLSLLTRHNLVRVDSDGGVQWCGGNTVLMVLGDMINKGPSSIATLDLIRLLQGQAPRDGGRVVPLSGNHEAEFLADPHCKKAEGPAGINKELRAMGNKPTDFVRDDNPRGHWLRTLPYGARVGSWFFAHGGNSEGRSFKNLQKYLEHAVDKDGFSTRALVGQTSILCARNWYMNNAYTGAKFSAALGTQHIVFGHDPGGLGAKGKIAMGQNGTLFRIDCGLSREVDYSLGHMLRVRREGPHEVVHACGAQGEEVLLLKYLKD